jgi:hypothetical protein
MHAGILNFEQQQGLICAAQALNWLLSTNEGSYDLMFCSRICHLHMQYKQKGVKEKKIGKRLSTIRKRRKSILINPYYRETSTGYVTNSTQQQLILIKLGSPSPAYFQKHWFKHMPDSRAEQLHGTPNPEPRKSPRIYCRKT